MKPRGVNMKKLKLLTLDFGENFSLFEKDYEFEYETEKIIFCKGYKIPKEKLGKICYVNAVPTQRFIAQFEDVYNKKKTAAELFKYALDLYAETEKKREKAAAEAMEKLKQFKAEQLRLLENVKKTLQTL